MIHKNSVVLIVGLGLIGGSYAKGLKKYGCTVYAITRSQATVDYALQNGIIDKGSVTEDSALIGRADFVVFGLYPITMLEWLERNRRFFKKGALITDVSGVKCGVVDRAQELLPETVEFIGSHPMAGREVSGVQYSDERMFEAANFIITPTPENTQNGIAFAKELAGILGFRHIAVLTPKEHDEMIGFVSQLTHALAVSLMNTKDNTHLKEYTGDSFRDLTRIAKINEDLWSELFFLNGEVLVREIDDFVAELENLKKKIAQHDEEGLKELFRQSARRRAEFDR